MSGKGLKQNTHQTLYGTNILYSIPTQRVSHTCSDTKKTRLGNQHWEGRDKQMAVEHVLTCHSVIRLSLIALLSTSGRIFKYRRAIIFGQKMSDCKTEWVNIKFLPKLKKSTTETFQLLTEAYGEDCTSRARMFEWHKQFSEDRESFIRSSRPRWLFSLISRVLWWQSGYPAVRW